MDMEIESPKKAAMKKLHKDINDYKCKRCNGKGYVMILVAGEAEPDNCPECSIDEYGII